MAITLGFVVSISFLIIVIIIVLAVFYSRQRREGSDDAATSLPGVKNVAIGKVTLCTRQTRSFSFDEVRAATTDFSHKIGEGRFGPVYYGMLPDGQEVAVKVRPTNYAQGGEQDGHLITEVHVLAKIHHHNLVSLLGYCLDPTNQVLIYEFMRNGTLRSHLQRSHMAELPLMTWRTRLVVMIDAARGLQSLHTDWNPIIFHRDFNSINVMLDEKMNAKVADFGVSKITLDDDSGIPTLLKCTAGYLDPEYFTTQKLTHKSDVYSFGVVLFEIISGRPPIMYSQDGNSWSSLVEWIFVRGKSVSLEWYTRERLGQDRSNVDEDRGGPASGMEPLWLKYAPKGGTVTNILNTKLTKSGLKDGNGLSIVDPSLKGLYAEESVRKVAELALACVEFHGPKRPDMEKVLLALADALHVEDNRQNQLLAATAAIPRSNDYTSPAKPFNHQLFYGVTTTPSSVSGFSFPRS